MIRNNSTDRGVSPVIGVVLMIAVTVILAAVVGSAVLDFSGDISPSAQGAVEFTEDSAAGTVDVTLMNSRNADIVRVEDPTNGVSNISGGEGTDGNLLLKSDGTGGPGTVVTVGGSTSLTSGDEVVVVAETESGDENVIQTYEFEG